MPDLTVPDGAAPPFADFLARERDDLLRLAVLLEGDRADAEDLLRGVLVRVRSRWRRLSRRGNPAREARRLLVRHVLARRSGGPRTSGWVDDPYAGWDAGRYDDLRRALSGLPVATRAAVVLSVWAGLPDDEVADLLRGPEDGVRGEVAAGLAPLRAALAPVAAPWGFAAHRPPDEDEVREELAALADEEVPAVDAATAATDVEREVAARRRRRWPVALAGAAAAVVVAVSALQGDEPAPAADPPTGRAEPAPDPVEVAVAELPTRGSLAGDRAFLDGLVRQPWKSQSPADYPFEVTTAEDSRRVLYAGDTPSGRWALVAGRPSAADPVQEGIGGPFDTDDLYMAWFTGPAGAQPQDMVMSTNAYSLVPGMTPALLDPPRGTLVVVAAPGDAVEVSERVEVRADGSDTRTWTPMEVTDGIATARLDPVDLPWTWAVNYRIFREDGLVSSAPPDGLLTNLADEMPRMPIDYPGGPPDPAGRRAAEWAAFIGLSSLGAPTDDTDITARVVRPAPSDLGTVALVTVTLPSGAFLVSAQWAWDIRDDLPGGADCGLDVRPADPPPEERLLAAGCQLFDPLDGRVLGHALVVSAPSEVATVRLYGGGDGAFLEEHEISGGALVTAMPEGTRSVEAVTANGVSLGRSQLLGHWSPTTD